jgi:hypothetical protein
MFNTNYIDKKGKRNNDKTQTIHNKLKTIKSLSKQNPKLVKSMFTQVNLKETYMISVFGIMLTKIFFERIEVSKKNYSIFLVKCSFYKQFPGVSMASLTESFEVTTNYYYTEIKNIT